MKLILKQSTKTTTTKDEWLSKYVDKPKLIDTPKGSDPKGSDAWFHIDALFEDDED